MAQYTIDLNSAPATCSVIHCTRFAAFNLDDSRFPSGYNSILPICLQCSERVRNEMHYDHWLLLGYDEVPGSIPEALEILTWIGQEFDRVERFPSFFQGDYKAVVSSNLKTHHANLLFTHNIVIKYLQNLFVSNSSSE